MDETTDALRRQVETLTDQALARCDRDGIAREDFYAALQKEKKLRADEPLAEVFERVFSRLFRPGKGRR